MLKIATHYFKEKSNIENSSMLHVHNLASCQKRKRKRKSKLQRNNKVK